MHYGVRLLLKHPGSTLLAVLTLTLAIGANSAVFSVVNGVLLRPLGLPNPDKLVIVWETQAARGIREFSVTPPDFQDWTARQRSFEGMAAFRIAPAILTGRNLPERVEVARVSSTMFPILGVAMKMGRPFTHEEEQAGKNRVAVISYGLWQRRFGGNAGVLNQLLTLDGNAYQVIGVAERTLQLLDTPSELWIPYVLDARELQALGKTPGAAGPRSASHTLRVIARLKPDVSTEMATQDMEGIARRLQQEHADTNEGWGTNVVGLREQLVGKARPTLWAMMIAVTFVLLIACSNAASLLLAQANARQKEFAVRSAMGASRARILSQLLTEGLLLSVASGALGCLLAYAAVRALIAFAPGSVPRMEDVTVDGRVLAVSALAALLTGLLAGTAPGLSASRAHVAEILKSVGRGNTGVRKTRLLRNTLIVFEIAFSLVLLIGAALMVRSFVKLQGVPPGFRSDHVLTMRFTLPKLRYDGLRVAQFHQQLLERVSAIPGVKQAGITRDLPLSGSDPSLNFIVEHRPALSTAQQPRAKFRAVSAGYFPAMGIPLVRGRYFSSSDTRENAGITVINQTMARQFFANQDAVGQRLQSGFDDSPWSTVVGIVGDIHHGGLDAEANAEMYFPYQQIPAEMMNFVEGTMTLVVSSAQNPVSLIRPVSDQIHSLDPEEAVFKVATMDDLLQGSTTQPRFRAYLLGVFAAIALVLASTGLYGVISFSVSQRTNEFGVRSALGAQKGDLIKLVMAEGAGLALVGIALGMVMSFSLANGLSKMLYSIQPHDTLAFTLVPAVLLVVALTANYIPALRATRTDPATALRHD